MRSISGDELDSVAMTAYAAAGDPKAWSDVSNALARLLDADSAVIFTPPVPGRDVLLWADSGAIREGRQAYADFWWREDPWRLKHEAERQVVHAGFLMRSESLVERKALERTAFYAGFARKYCACEVLASCIEDDYAGTPRVHLSLTRGERGRTFETDAEEFLRMLQPRLRRAVRAHWALVGARHLRGAVEATLDALANAALLLSDDLRVLFANRVLLQHTARSSQPVRVAANRLISVAQWDERVLMNLVAAALRGTTQSMRLRWTDVAGNHQSTLHVSSLDARASGTPYANAALVVVEHVDPAGDQRRRLEEFCATHSITSAQRDLLLHVIRGGTVETAARARGVTVSTARTQVRRILERTGTRRLSDVLAALGEPR